MKKGLLAVTLLLVMGLLFGCAHTNAGTSPTPQTTAKDSPKVSAASQATASPKTAEPKATAASQKYEEKVEAMVPVFDSIARYLVEEDGIYDAKDSTCFWTVLYLLANNYGATDSLVTAVDGGLRFPKKLMQEYATACFSDYEDLLELPEGFTIEYDENYDAYTVPGSDASESETKITGVESVGNGSYLVKVSFVSKEDGDVLANLEYRIVPNKYVDGISDPKFYYSVSGARIV